MKRISQIIITVLTAMAVFAGIYYYAENAEAKTTYQANKDIADAAYGYILNGNEKALERLLEKGLKPDELRYGNKWAIHLAVGQSDAKIAELLLEYGANPDKTDANGFPPIIYAVENGGIELADMLADYGANTNFETETGLNPLLYAIKKQQYIIALELIDLGADPNFRLNNGYTPLIFALEKTGEDFIAKLIRAGADPDLIAKTGYSPLLFAIELNNLDYVKILVENGAEVNLNSRLNDPPLASALMKNRNRIAEYLIEMGADINFIDNENRTPLVYAASSNNYEMAEYLLSRGANPNINGLKDFPLQSAVSFGSTEIVELLLKYGADPELTDKEGMNILDIKVSEKNKKAVEIVENIIFEKYWLTGWNDFASLFNRYDISPDDFDKYDIVSSARFLNNLISPQNKNSQFKYYESKYSFNSPRELLEKKVGDCDELSSLLANIYSEILGTPMEDMVFVLAHGMEVSGVKAKDFDHSALVVKLKGVYYLADPANDIFKKLNSGAQQGRLDEISGIFVDRISGPHSEYKSLKIDRIVYKPLVSLIVNQILNRKKAS